MFKIIIFYLLRSHSCFHNLPKDVRTLLNTSRAKTIVIIDVLSCFLIDFLPNQIDIDFNIDGCNLDRLGNIKHIKPIIVGVYKSSAKPYNSNLFFKNGGIFFKKKKLSIRLRYFITDASAGAFILNHTSHLSCHSCSKCIEYIRSLDEEHHKEGTSPLSLLPRNRNHFSSVF
ncbi:hypothetical protein ACFW04_014014 [Cataglyphis niger]